MQQYFISNKNFKENIITGNDVFHIQNVVRLNAGEQIIVASEGKRYLALITSISKEYVSYSIIDELSANEPPYQLTVIQGMAKADKNEQIIKSASALGATTIVFVRMERSIAFIDGSKVEKKLDRYQKMAKEEAEVAQRASIPTIKIMDFKQALKENSDIKILLDEDEHSSSIADLLIDNPQSITLIIGPEGGISAAERKLAIENQFVPAHIGARIYRTELAGLVALAMISYAKELKQ